MRFWIIPFLLFLSYHLAQGQDIKADTIVTDTDTAGIEEPKKTIPLALYAEGSVNYVPTKTGYNYTGQLGMGIAYKRLHAGIYQSFFLGEITTILIFPNQFELLYTYGGGYLELKVVDSKFIEAGIRANYGLGDMVWENSTSNEDFARDKFRIVRPEVTVSFVPARFAKLYAALGYNKFLDLNLPSINSDEFSGLTLGIGMTIGYFGNE